MAKQKFRDLTTEELDAIRDYAEEKGRNWKSALSTDWMYARRPGILQALRNELGPAWLTQFKLPPVHISQACFSCNHEKRRHAHLHCNAARCRCDGFTTESEANRRLKKAFAPYLKF